MEDRIMKKDEWAQVGIGTLIVFIAMVIIAAVAASLLIQTSGTLQQKAQSTGKQAIQEVSSNLIVKNVEGIRAKTSSDNLSDTVDILKLKVALNVGSSPVDIYQLLITITDGTNKNNLIYAGNGNTYGNKMIGFSSTNLYSDNLAYLLNGSQVKPGANCRYFFTADKLRDEDGSFTQENPVLTTGDIVTVYISTMSQSGLPHTRVGSDTKIGAYNDSNFNIVTRTNVNIALIPETGAATAINFITPSSYGMKETVRLYP